MSYAFRTLYSIGRYKYPYNSAIYIEIFTSPQRGRGQRPAMGERDINASKQRLGQVF